MKINLATAVFLYGYLSVAFAGGTVIRNGGDPDELSFQEIANNIKGWIASGNADNLNLPPDIPISDYKGKMTAVLSNYAVEFTDQDIVVNGAAKVCENRSHPDRIGWIICNRALFQALVRDNIESIFRLVHHEFAGLAGLEISSAPRSDYRISDQVAAQLENEVVRRLPIAPKFPIGSNCSSKPIGQQEFIKKVFKPGQSHRKLDPAPLMSRHRDCTKLTGCSNWTDWRPLSKLAQVHLTAKDTLSMDLSGETELSDANEKYTGRFTGTCLDLGSPQTCPFILNLDMIAEVWTVLINAKVTLVENCIIAAGIYNHRYSSNWDESEYYMEIRF